MSGNGNYTSDLENLRDAKWAQIRVLTLSVLIIFFNCLLQWVILKSKTMRKKRFNKIMVSLSLTDLMVGVLINLPTRRWSFKTYLTQTLFICCSWPFGPTVCNLITSLEVILLSASVFHFLAANIDRWVDINNGSQYGNKVIYAGWWPSGIQWDIPLMTIS